MSRHISPSRETELCALIIVWSLFGLSRTSRKAN